MKQFKERLMGTHQVTDSTMKVFSYKGAAILACACILGTVAVPALLEFLSIGSKIATVCSTALFGSLGICYVRNFVDSKKGMSKNLVFQFLIFFFAFFVIGYYWVFYQYYI